MLKLGKLPNRTPSKISVTLSTELSGALNDYAAIYRDVYGEAASVADLIPFMLEAFLASDKAFAKARKTKSSDVNHERRSRPARKSLGDDGIVSSSTSMTEG